MAGRIEMNNAADTEGVIAIPGKGIILAAGDTVPTDNDIGYSPGCVFIQTDTTDVNTSVYTNIGTSAACNFDPLKG
jgi:hypothetical protein